MRFALARVGLARPAASLLAPRTAAFLPFIRFESTSAPETPKKSRPYTFGFTNSMHYPIYPRTRAAGEFKYTIIKKIEGDNRAFAKDLVKELGYPKDDVKINPVTNTVSVKGEHVQRIRAWLIHNFGPRPPSNPNSTEVKA